MNARWRGRCEGKAIKRLHGANRAESFGIWEAEGFARDSLKFEKRCQFFVGGDDEPLSVITVCISNEDCFPVGINR
jgi:hypothetical protein